MDKTKLSRKEKEKLRHKEEILEAALNLFSSKGFHNVSMQDIASESEFGIGTLYNFFGSKEALFNELIDNTEERVVSEFLEILNKPGSEKKRLAAFIRHQPKFQEKHSKVIKLYISEVGIKNSKLSQIRGGSKAHRVLDAKVAQLIEAGIHKSLFRTVDSEIAAKMLSSTIEMLIFEATDGFDKDKVTETFKKLEQLFLEGLLKPKGKSNE